MTQTLRILIVLVCMLATARITAQTSPEFVDIPLWENSLPPASNGTEAQPPDEQNQRYKPMIRVYLPPKVSATGRAVIACPGGGYQHLAYNHEGYDFAPYFTQRGIAFVVLIYRMPMGGHYDVPVSDAEEAIRLVKAHAAEWNIRPDDVGIMGSSAGGHLASTVATHAPAELRPAFQILLYPVITMDSAFTHAGSRKNLLGEHPDPDLLTRFSNEKQVTGETPRAFIAYSDDDRVVPPRNGVEYYLALKKYGIPASLHIYPSGGHGWGVRANFKYHENFLSDLGAWLDSF